MYEYADIKFAMCAVRVLGIIFLVAIWAFASKSRAVFVAGTLGSLLGYIVPEPDICIDGTAEGCFMGYLDWTAGHILSCGVAGAFLASSAVAVFQALQRAGRIPKQYSLRTLLLATTAIAAALAIIRFLAT
jgi:hypothetical protein